MSLGRPVSYAPLFAAPPSIRIGYLDVRVEVIARSRVSPSGRYHSHFDWDSLTIRLSNRLQPEALARYFLTWVIALGHWVHGVQYGSEEESFTQSFASNLVRFALDNPYAWFWVNSLLETRSTGYLRVLQGPLAERPPRRPRVVVVDSHVWTVKLVSLRDPVWGYCVPDEQRIELQRSNPVAMRAAIFLHELGHAFHHHAGMGVGHSNARFSTVQATSLVTFIQSNPLAWRWVLDGIRRIAPSASAQTTDARRHARGR